jgi:TIGR03009 family protein
MWQANLRLVPAIAAGLLLISPSAAQQYQPPQPGAAQSPPQARPQAPATAAPQPPLQLPAEFRLNDQQQLRLDLILDKWQIESAKVNRFRCQFERREFNRAFGPAEGVPLFRNQGELSFEKPDKGSFQITQINKWQFSPVPPGQPAPQQRTGNWVPDPAAVGEHWVCDGKYVYEYRHDQKQLVVRPIPAELQGRGIVDGPLPFLFGAEAAKLKARYWLREDEDFAAKNPTELKILALPKFQADAANYSKVIVVLDKEKMLPSDMLVQFPNGDYNVYTFDLKNAKINDAWEQMKKWFSMPELLPGWKRVEEQMPTDQAAQPQGLRR